MHLYNLIDCVIKYIRRNDYLPHYTMNVLRYILESNRIPAEVLNRELPKLEGTFLPTWPPLWETHAHFWYMT